MSKYVSVRKSAQRALDSITHLYDGTRSILMPMFFEALKRKLCSSFAFKSSLRSLGAKVDRLRPLQLEATRIA